MYFKQVCHVAYIIVKLIADHLCQRENRILVQYDDEDLIRREVPLARLHILANIRPFVWHIGVRQGERRINATSSIAMCATLIWKTTGDQSMSIIPHISTTYRELTSIFPRCIAWVGLPYLSVSRVKSAPP